MSDRAGASIGWWRWPLILACLPLAWLAVRNAAQALSSANDPAIAARFWPADGASLANMALSRVIAAGGAVDATSAALARHALLRSPRAATPLVVAGLAASAAGDLAKAQALMEAARARQPRTDTARFWLLDHYMRTGNYAAGLDEIGPTTALRGASGPALMDLVGGLATVPAAHHALVAKLETEPRWRVPFFQREANAALPPGAIQSLLEALPPNSDPVAAAAEQRAVIGALIARKDYAGAYGVWLSFLPRSDRSAANAVYDPDFHGLAGAEPFNWSLQPTPDVGVSRITLADIREGSGLAIDFRATAARPIASETVPTPAGAYTFSLKARRVGDQTANGRIIATLTCLADGHMLATLPLDSLSATLGRSAVDLSIPTSCPFVGIGFSGEPGDIFGTVSAQITAIGLIRH